MIFWLLTVGIICLALGFVMGATFRQYVPLVGKHKDGGFREGPTLSNVKRHSHSPPVPMPPPPPRKASERIEAKLDVLVQQTRKPEWCGAPL